MSTAQSRSAVSISAAHAEALLASTGIRLSYRGHMIVCAGSGKMARYIVRWGKEQRLFQTLDAARRFVEEKQTAASALGAFS
jgi:hypothetical protein